MAKKVELVEKLSRPKQGQTWFAGINIPQSCMSLLMEIEVMWSIATQTNFY